MKKLVLILVLAVLSVMVIAQGTKPVAGCPIPTKINQSQFTGWYDNLCKDTVHVISFEMSSSAQQVMLKFYDNGAYIGYDITSGLIRKDVHILSLPVENNTCANYLGIVRNHQYSFTTESICYDYHSQPTQPIFFTVK